MDSIAELAGKQLAWEMESRKSVEVQVTTAITNHVAASSSKQVFDTVEEHYIETAAGQRFCDFRGVKSGSGKVVARSAHFGGGRKFADISFVPENPEVQQSISIKRQYWMEESSDRRQLPAPLLFLYVGREPLYEALPKAQSLGKGEVMGRECNVFLFTQVRWSIPQDQVFYLDKITSIPLKVESFRDKESREKNEPLGVWTAKSLDKIQGHFAPLKSTQTAYSKDGSLSLTWDFTVNSIAFNEEYPASTFWPAFQPGVTVLDGISNKSYVVPGARRRRKTSKKRPRVPRMRFKLILPTIGLEPRRSRCSALALPS